MSGMSPSKDAFGPGNGLAHDVGLALGKRDVDPSNLQLIVTNENIGDGVAAVLKVKDPQKVDWKAVFELLGRRQLLENPYVSEKTSTDRGYPKDYRPTAPSTQFKKLHKLYHDLDGTHIPEITRNLGKLEGSDELFQVVPKLVAIARLHGIADPYGTGYGRCLEVMLKHIAKASPSFVNYRKGCLSDKYVRLLADTREYLEWLEASTPGDYNVIPMQSGKLWAGYSVRNARIEIVNAGQWAHPAWVVGHHLLTHPKRLPAEGYLNQDTGGDEYSPYAGGRFTGSLGFSFWGGGLGFGGCWTSGVGACFGSASGSRREK